MYCQSRRDRHNDCLEDERQDDIRNVVKSRFSSSHSPNIEGDFEVEKTGDDVTEERAKRKQSRGSIHSRSEFGWSLAILDAAAR